MATRCNVIVKGKSCGKNVKAILYRHWDGYPSVTGEDLLEKLNSCCNGEIYFDSFVNSLIKESTEYEYTSQIHGDIEYLYEIDCCKRTIKVMEVGYDSETMKQTFGKKQDVKKMFGVTIKNEIKNPLEDNFTILTYKMEVGTLTLPIVENSLDAYCSENGFDLTMKRGKGILSKPLNVTIAVPTHLVKQTIADIQNIFQQ